MSARNGAELLLLAALWGASFLLMRLGAADFTAVALVLVTSTDCTPRPAEKSIRVGITEMPPAMAVQGNATSHSQDMSDSFMVEMLQAGQ